MQTTPQNCRVWWTSPARGDTVPRERRERRALERTRSRELLETVRPAADAPVSLTHSHGCAGVAVGSPGMRVGIDLEREADRDCARLADFAYSPEESAWLRALDVAERQRCFYQLWTLKEAFAKALTLDLAVALAECRFTPAAGGLLGSVPTSASWSATVFSPHPGYRLAVVSIDGTGFARHASLEFAGAPGVGRPHAGDFVRAVHPARP
jgi:phosphopantetheinyl transferase